MTTEQLYPLVLVISQLPMSLNKLLTAHWSVRHHEKDSWAALVRDAAIQIAVDLDVSFPALQAGQKRMVTLSYYFKDKRRRDADNYMKVILDALVRNGLLVDDAPEWCETTVVFHVDKKNPRTEIVLNRG